MLPSFLTMDRLGQRLDEHIANLEYAGALITYALGRENAIIGCRALFSRTKLTARRARDYGELQLYEEWIDAKRVAATVTDDLTTRVHVPRLAGLTIGVDLDFVVPVFKCPGELELDVESPPVLPLEHRIVSQTIGAWSSWVIACSFEPLASIPLGALVRAPLPPHASAYEAIGAWFRAAPPAGAVIEHSPVLWVGKLFAIIPDPRARIAAVEREDRTLHVTVDGAATLQVVAHGQPLGNSTDPASTWQLPPGATSALLYLVDGAELLQRVSVNVPAQDAVATQPRVTAPPKLRVRILHISDLHARGERGRDERWRRHRVLGDEWAKNLDALLAERPIDVIAFTGDLADRGAPDEYGEVGELIADLLMRCRLPRERLFVVPGNHDIQRGVEVDAWRTLRAAADQVNYLELARWSNGGRAPFGLDASVLERVRARGAAYRAFVTEELGRPELAPPDRLGWRAGVRLEGWPFDLQLIGLDSSWLCGDDHDAGKLLLCDSQVGRLTTGDDGKPLSGFRIALVHHPMSELRSDDERACRPLLADHTDLLLRGHLHAAQAVSVIDPDRAFRQLAAGCLYEGHGADQYPNACHVVDAELDPSGRPLRYDIHFRSWSRSGGFWHSDSSLYRDARDGRLSWTVAPSTTRR